jgi:hypothetical protein
MRVSAITSLVLLMCMPLVGCVTTRPEVLLHEEVRDQPDDYVVLAVRNDIVNLPQVGGNGRRYGGADYLESAQARRVLTRIADEYRLREVSGWPIPMLDMHCVLFKMPPGESMTALLTRLRADARVMLAQPLQTFSTSTEEKRNSEPTYNDPYASLQTNLVQMGVLQLQQRSRGKNIRVAVIDTGVDVTHPELQGRIELQRNYVDRDQTRFDADRHGTAVAGVIVANANNGIGMVGIAPEAKLLALKACWQLQADHDAASCNSFTLAQALAGAINANAQVINLSLTGPQDPLLSALIARAQHKGIVVVGAAGNRDQPFPAQVPDVLSVAGLDSEPSGQALRAPGRDVFSLRPGNRYDFISGNSMATAEVTGAVALVLGEAPSSRLTLGTPAQVRNAFVQAGLTLQLTPTAVAAP